MSQKSKKTTKMSKPEGSIFLLLKASGESDFTDDHITVLELTRDYIKSLVSKIGLVQELKEKDSNMLSLESFDYSAEFYTWGEVSAVVRNVSVMDKAYKGFAVLRNNPPIGESEVRVDCQTLVAFSDSVKWTAYFKNTDISLTTNCIYLRDLKRLNKYI